LTDSYQELLEESQQRRAFLEGRLAQLQDQLAAALASEEQDRQELEISRVELSVATAALAQAQREAADREALLRRRLSELEDQVAEARRIQHTAEKERAAVIAALGWRARRHLDRDETADREPSS
jgi:hypothetical protein